jgi:hypothetical protein
MIQELMAMHIIPRIKVDVPSKTHYSKIKPEDETKREKFFII